MKINNIPKKYIKEVKYYLPLYGRKERMFLFKLKNQLTEYSENETNMDASHLYEFFGSPQETAYCYINSFDEKDLLNQIRNYKWKKRIMTLVCAVFLFISIAFVSVSTYLYSETLKTEINEIEVVLRINEKKPGSLQTNR